MSILANQIKFGYSQIRRKGGGTVDQVDAPVAANVTIQKGDWLKLASGLVTPAITKVAGAFTLAGATPGLYAVALGSITTNASGVATDGSGRTTIPVGLLNDDTEAMVGIWNTTNTNATQANVNVGTTYDFGVFMHATLPLWGYMVGTTTGANAPASLVEKSPESGSNEQYGFVWVKPVAAARVGA